MGLCCPWLKFLGDPLFLGIYRLIIYMGAKECFGKSVMLHRKL